MAGDDQGEAIGGHRVANRACGSRLSGGRGQLAITLRLAVPDRPTLPNDPPLKRGQVFQIESNIAEIVRHPSGVFLQSVHQPGVP